MVFENVLMQNYFYAKQCHYERLKQSSPYRSLSRATANKFPLSIAFPYQATEIEFLLSIMIIGSERKLPVTRNCYL